MLLWDKAYRMSCEVEAAGVLKVVVLSKNPKPQSHLVIAGDGILEMAGG